MPWRETSAMDERLRFVRRCRSRINRTTVGAVVRLILDLQRRYTWGARKVRRLLQARVPADQVPTKTTIHRILERHGRVRPRRRSSRRMHPGAPGTPMEQPNAVWTADFKGQFRTGNGVYCYPLTVQDGATRYLLGCRGLLAPTTEASWPVFARLFRRYGLPARIRTDNGQPFASNALGRLSTLSVWWVRLGVRPELIEPAHPEQNGRHERMHKTLKADTARPPQADLAAQQRRFDWFRQRYNTERPHEALGDATPASCYEPSPRPYCATLDPVGYPGHFERRRVSRNGAFGGGIAGSTRAICSQNSRSASRRSTTVCGTCTSVRSGSARFHETT